ncbi:MAG: hypothetical protein MHM6MM_003388 [Cercozoa sp. M6MM]
MTSSPPAMPFAPQPQNGFYPPFFQQPPNPPMFAGHASSRPAPTRAGMTMPAQPPPSAQPPAPPSTSQAPQAPVMSPPFTALPPLASTYINGNEDASVAGAFQHPPKSNVPAPTAAATESNNHSNNNNNSDNNSGNPPAGTRARAKRLQKSQREKYRRSTINNAFNDLAAVLDVQEKRAQQVVILRTARQVVCDMRHEIESLRAQLKMQQARLSEVGGMHPAAPPPHEAPKQHALMEGTDGTYYVHRASQQSRWTAPTREEVESARQQLLRQATKPREPITPRYRPVGTECDSGETTLPAPKRRALTPPSSQSGSTTPRSRPKSGIQPPPVMQFPPPVRRPAMKQDLPPPLALPTNTGVGDLSTGLTPKLAAANLDGRVVPPAEEDASLHRRGRSQSFSSFAVPPLRAMPAPPVLVRTASNDGLHNSLSQHIKDEVVEAALKRRKRKKTMFPPEEEGNEEPQLPLQRTSSARRRAMSAVTMLNTEDSSTLSSSLLLASPSPSSPFPSLDENDFPNPSYFGEAPLFDPSDFASAEVW